MYIERQEGLLHTHGQNYANAQFAELEEHPCSPVEDGFLTAGTALLMLAPFIIIFAFAVF